MQNLDITAGLEVLKTILRGVSSLKANLQAKGARIVETNLDDVNRYLVPLDDLEAARAIDIDAFDTGIGHIDGIAGPITKRKIKDLLGEDS